MCVCESVCVCFRPDSLFIQIDCNAKYNVHIVNRSISIHIHGLVVLGVS